MYLYNVVNVLNKRTTTTTIAKVEDFDTAVLRYGGVRRLYEAIRPPVLST